MEVSLVCNEKMWPEEDNDGSIGETGTSSSTSSFSAVDDLNFDGIKSVVDRRIVGDDRVLENVIGFVADGGGSAGNYFETVQTEIKPHMRKIVCEWMLEICEEQGCQPEVFALSVDYLDRALSRLNVRKSQFQLLASVCVFVASKFKETSPMCADKLVVYSDFSITTSEITRWELLLLDLLGWDLSCPTPQTILDQLLYRIEAESAASGRVGPFSLKMIRTHSETFLSMMATDHAYCAASRPLLAISCLLAAFNGLKKSADEAAFVANLTANLCDLAALTPDEVATGVEVIEAAMRVLIPPTEPAKQQSNVAVAEGSSSNNNNNSIKSNNGHAHAVLSTTAAAPSATTTPTDVMDVSLY